MAENGGVEDFKEDVLVSFQELERLTGFPQEILKKELLSGDEAKDEIPLSELRKLMLKYLDMQMSDN